MPKNIGKRQTNHRRLRDAKQYKSYIIALLWLFDTKRITKTKRVDYTWRINAKNQKIIDHKNNG